MGFIRFVLIVLLIYYLLKLLVRWLFPFWLERMMNKMQKRMENQQQYQQKKRGYKKEGDITINQPNVDKSTPKEKKEKVGEYTDFEEIE